MFNFSYRNHCFCSFASCYFVINFFVDNLCNSCGILSGCLLTSEFFYAQIFDLFDVKKKGVIDFDDFVRSLNVFHPNAPLEDKIDCKLKIESSTLCRLH